MLWVSLRIRPNARGMTYRACKIDKHDRAKGMSCKLCGAIGMEDYGCENDRLPDCATVGGIHGPIHCPRCNELQLAAVLLMLRRGDLRRGQVHAVGEVQGYCLPRLFSEAWRIAESSKSRADFRQCHWPKPACPRLAFCGYYQTNQNPVRRSGRAGHRPHFRAQTSKTLVVQR